MLRVNVDGKKYTVIHDASGRLIELRHGERWRELTGDNLVYNMAYEIHKLRELLRKALPVIAADMVPPYSEPLAEQVRTALEYHHD